MLLCLSKCPALVLQLILLSCQCAIMASRADFTYRREKESATTIINTQHKTHKTVPLQLCHQNTVPVQLQHADPSSISFLCCQGAARSYTRSEQIIIELFLPPTDNVRGRGHQIPLDWGFLRPLEVSTGFEKLYKRFWSLICQLPQCQCQKQTKTVWIVLIYDQPGCTLLICTNSSNIGLCLELCNKHEHLYHGCVHTMCI